MPDKVNKAEVESKVREFLTFARLLSEPDIRRVISNLSLMLSDKKDNPDKIEVTQG